MLNSKKYHFSDFTFDSYRLLLKEAKKNYLFSTYDNFNKNERFILWRHDIDFSVHKAVQLAKIECEEGVFSTFFIHLHSEFYHFFEKDVYQKIGEIAEMGHKIGLHFDSHFYGLESENELENHIKFERDLLEKILEKDIKVFSFHNTNPFVMNCKRDMYAGLINTYSDYFQKKVGYCSDSYGVWRFRRLKDVLECAEDNQLQVLTHPELWDEEELSPIQRVFKCIDGRANTIKSNYTNFLKRNDRTIIDW